MTAAQAIIRGHGSDIVLSNLPDGGLAALLTLPQITWCSSVESARRLWHLSPDDAWRFVYLGVYGMDYVASFFAGAFLCNCIPHLTCGLRGEIFPTPFARPRGKGPSSPLVNFLWGVFNVLLGLYLLSRHPVAVDLNPGFIALTAGALAVGIYLSQHFGKVRQDRSAG